jgi:hypothetical protein
VPKTVPITFRNAVYSQQMTDVPVVLLRATHPNLSEPIRVSSDPTKRMSVQLGYMAPMPTSSLLFSYQLASSGADDTANKLWNDWFWNGQAQYETQPTSLWGTEFQGDNYLFVWMSAAVPGEEEDSSPGTKIVLEDVEHQVGDLLRSFSTPATITLTLISAAAPDIIIRQWIDLRTIQAQGDAERCTVEISREPFNGEPSPLGRFTKGYFPGMHR